MVKDDFFYEVDDNGIACLTLNLQNEKLIFLEKLL